MALHGVVQFASKSVCIVHVVHGGLISPPPPPVDNILNDMKLLIFQKIVVKN